MISIVKLDVENDNVVWALSNVINMNVKIYKVGSTFVNVLNFNADLTLPDDFATSYQSSTKVEITFKCLLRGRCDFFSNNLMKCFQF